MLPRRVRAALLALIAVSATFAAAAPSASAGYEPFFTIGGYSISNGPRAITGHTSGLCTNGGTIDFHIASTGRVMGEDGPTVETGTMTIERIDGVLRVTDLESTFTLTSSRAQIEGRRWGVSTETTVNGPARNEVTCGGATAQDRWLKVAVQSYYETTKFDIFDNRWSDDRGYASFEVSEYAAGANPNPYRPSAGGYYFTFFTSDQDWDGVRWLDDNCQQVYNPGQEDRNGGDEGDACDGDYDDDDRHDAFYDNCVGVYNPDQKDTDRDGKGDACDPPDVELDRDDDGVNDTADNCPDAPNPGQENAGGDARGDACEDRDGDGLLDAGDNCAAVPNADQANTGGDGRGDACEDRDGDSAYDNVDNCVDVAASQLDSDGDGHGDACDADDDGDGVDDFGDNCVLVPNATQRDSDSDGDGDACDGTFDSSDGHATGGGFLSQAGRKVHLSFSARSVGGLREGRGHVVDGRREVKLLDVTGLRQDGGRAVIVGSARVDGETVPYRLEVVDGGEPGAADTVELEAGAYTLAGALAGGNLQVR